MEDFIHATVGYETPDEECDLDYTPVARTDKTVKVALSNSLGFGGHNATLLIKKFVQ
jgi:3-oxoacyl-[acyl-carrier-protein] synthase II